MERDDKIDALANHLTVTHQDNVRLLEAAQKLTEEVRTSKQVSSELQGDLASFTAEARLLVNDRIEEMSVERLADALSRKKVDQVRAFIYAREKGIPYEPPTREPTQPVKTHAREEAEDERHDPWYSRGWRASLRANPKTLSALGWLVFSLALFAVAAIGLLYMLDHSHILPRSGQQHSELK